MPLPGLNCPKLSLRRPQPKPCRGPGLSWFLSLTLALGLQGIGPMSLAQTATAATATAKAKSSKKAPSRTGRGSRQTKAPAPPPKPEPAPEPLSEQQLEVATRVQTGVVDCEFKQQVDLQAVVTQPGRFHLSHKGKRYTMVPEPTSSGAVRLEDVKAGIVWLQIPAKSMLMNTRVGQRLVDNCQNAQQLADQAQDLAIAQAASAAGQAAAPGLLISPTPAGGQVPPPVTAQLPEPSPASMDALLLLDW